MPKLDHLDCQVLVFLWAPAFETIFSQGFQDVVISLSPLIVFPAFDEQRCG